MTLNELLKAVDALTPAELQQLLKHIEQRQRQSDAPTLDALDHALEALRAGLSNRQLDQIEWAMNLETTQPLDKSAWQE